LTGHVCCNDLCCAGVQFLWRKFSKGGDIGIRMTYFPRTVGGAIRRYKVIRGALIGIAYIEIGKIR
jgi:hypothetical protein